jgi:acetyl esterase/lipase
MAQQTQLTVDDVLSGDPIPADHRIPYGDHPMQFGDLRIPDGDGPFPFAILIHGGCWQSIASLQYFDRVAEAITAMGVVTWNLEYRPVDVEGGGWPGTFMDVGQGVDKLREVAAEFDLAMMPTITLGHSAGGHLALWAAGRSRIPADSELYVEDPLPVGGAISLAGIPELRRYRQLETHPCGEGIVDRLMGGSPGEVPDRYIAASPFQMLPLNVRQVHITGRSDDIAPFRQVSAYNYESQSAGDSSQLIVVSGAGHYEVVWPGTDAWSQVEQAVRSMLGL